MPERTLSYNAASGTHGTATPQPQRELAMAWRQYRLERRMFWRNPSAAFFNFVLPLLFLALFGAIFSGQQDELDVLVPGIAGMAIMATTFSTLTMNLVFLREQGVLKRISGTPMSTRAYITGMLANNATNAAIQLAIVIVCGKLFFGTGWPLDYPLLLLYAVVGVVCMASLGIAWSHVIPNFESATAYSNIIFLPMIFISGVFYDSDSMPSVLQDIAQVLPLVHIVDGLSAALVTSTSFTDNVNGLIILALWMAVGLYFAVRGFRWEARRA
jgi:ABC-2 type transport system permease protein